MGTPSSQFLRFCVVGTAGFIVDAGFLQLFAKAVGLDPYTSRAISFLVAATVTWRLNRRFTFEASPHVDTHREWLRYVSINAVGGGLNYLTYVFCVLRLAGVRHHLILGVTAGSAVGLLVNYTASKYLVFKTGAKSADDS